MKKNKWILLAEDDEHIAELTVLALDSPDKVVVARDGLEALDYLYHRNLNLDQTLEDVPAVVLLDLKMPKVNGLEVLRKIKADPSLKSVPVVMLTSSREGSDLNRSYKLGANAYVVKPADFQKFNEAVKQTRRFWMTVNERPPKSETKIPEHLTCELAAGALPA